MDGKELECGLIMPISSIDGCSSEHWDEVRQIITEALEETEFKVSLVSDASDVGIIQKRIVQNIYTNEIVICDVSAKNPNVMFELGMRLAFDKPTIIIKDDETNYSFDTSPIEHIEYPRNLHYASIKLFKTHLKEKVIATFEASKKPGYTTFLKHFGEFKVAEIDSKEVSKEDFMLETINDLRQDVLTLNRKMNIALDIPISYRSNESRMARKEIDEYVSLYGLKHQRPLKDLSDFNGEHFLHMVESYVREYIPESVASKPRHIQAIKNQFEASVSKSLDRLNELAEV